MSRKNQDSPKAEMTPMIDVVFQLMIFFVVTIKQEDIFSKLSANVPTPNSDSKPTEEKDTSIKIDIGKDDHRMDVVLLNGSLVSSHRNVPWQYKDNRGEVHTGVEKNRLILDKLDKQIQQLASVSTKSTVLLRCDLNSDHGVLMRVLDICHKYKMNNLSILSM